MKNRSISSALAVFVAVLLLTLPVRAGLDWCDSDPVVLLDGVPVQILVSIPPQSVSRVKGATWVVIAIPKSVSRKVVSTDAGFRGYGEQVRFRKLKGDSDDDDDEFRVKLRVSAPLKGAASATGRSVPMKVTVIMPGRVPMVSYGTTKLTEASFKVQLYNDSDD